MDPTVVAAWIAAGVSVLTLLGTVITQIIGFRAASKDAEKTAEKAEKTAEDQRMQLDRTLGEQRTRTWNERFATAAEQLGSDKPPAVRLAGVYAMAGLADDWEANRQTCVDVLCAYLRMPYEPDPSSDGSVAEHLAFKSNREVRHTVIRVITAHLQKEAGVSWQGLNFDFTGVVFDGGSFAQARFSGGTVSFNHAEFSGSEVSFFGAQFVGVKVNFVGAKFSGGQVKFFAAQLVGCVVDFRYTEFSGSEVSFLEALFVDSDVNFSEAVFSGGLVGFYCAQFPSGRFIFSGARFSGGRIYFSDAVFCGIEIYFGGARFSGGEVSFNNAVFSGGTVDFSRAGDWSHPPKFTWTDPPPPGVKLPPSGTA